MEFAMCSYASILNIVASIWSEYVRELVFHSFTDAV